MEVFEEYELDKNVGAVVFGLDTEFTYSKLAIASLYVNELNCKLIVTNDDTFMNVNGRKYPSAGTLLSSLIISIKEETKVEIVGKPNPFCL